MRAVVIHTPGRATARSATTPTRWPGRARRSCGSPPRPSYRWTCCAPPARRTSASRRVPYVPGVQGVGVVEQSDALAGRHPGVVRDRRRHGARATAAWPSCCVVPDDDLVPLDRRARRRRSSPRSACRRVAAWMCADLAGPAPARARRCSCSAPAERSARSAIGAARVLGAGRVVAVCRPGRAPDARPGGRRRRGRRAARRRRRRWPPRCAEAVGGRRRRGGRPGVRRGGDGRPRGCSRTAGGWSTSAARRPTRRRSPRPCCAAGRPACSATPTTRSPRTSGATPSPPCSSTPRPAGSASTHETHPLADVADLWGPGVTDRGSRLVLLP